MNIKNLDILSHYFKLGLKTAETAHRIWEGE